MAVEIATQLDGMSINTDIGAMSSSTATIDGTTAANSASTSPRSSNSLSIASSDNSSTDSDAKFNPTAKPFMPTSSPLTRQPATPFSITEQRPSKNGGLGLFAKCPIPRGALILSETPLLSIHDNQTHLVWGPYCRLSNADKKFYDSLHSHQPESMDLEQIARAQLIDYSDKELDDDDINDLVAEQVRVMGVFAVNNFQKPGCPGLHIFKLVSRMNHSCVPNVFHSYNPMLGRMQVHAAKNINEGDEIVTNYLGVENAFMVRSQRIERLRAAYGFTCQCSACNDTTRQSDARRESIHHRHQAVQFYVDGVAAGTEGVHIPDGGVAMAEMHRAAEALIQEGLEGMELARARRLMSAVALMMQDFEDAMLYAHWEAVIERNCMGVYLDDLIASGRAAITWIEHVQQISAAHVRPGVPHRRQKQWVNPSFAYRVEAKKKKTKAQQKSKKHRKAARKERREQKENAVAEEAVAVAKKKKQNDEIQEESSEHKNQEEKPGKESGKQKEGKPEDSHP